MRNKGRCAVHLERPRQSDGVPFILPKARATDRQWVCDAKAVGPTATLLRRATTARATCVSYRKASSGRTLA